MSDSDDNAFASADEGEDVDAKQKQQEKQAHGKTKVEKSGDAKEKSGNPPKGVKQPAPASGQKDDVKKDKGRQQKNRKGKSGGPSAQAKKTTSEKRTDSAKAEEKPTDEGDSKTGTKADKKDSGTKQSKQAEVDTDSKSAAGKSIEALTAVAGASSTPISKERQEKAETKDAKETTSVAQPGASSVKSPTAQSIAPADRDNQAAKQDDVSCKTEEKNPQSSGWGWSSWGSSLLSAASTSVQTFTNQVGDGLTTIIDTVESSLGVPDAAALAEADKADNVQEPRASENVPATSPPLVTDAPEQQAVTRQPEEDSGPLTGKADAQPNPEKPDKGEDGSTAEKAAASNRNSANNWFSSWGVGDIAKKMQDTGKSLAAKGQTLMTEGFDAVEHLAAGGIDVLETIGKKTYSTLAEHDPALKRTRQFLSPRANRPNLSSTLREAREQAEKQQEQEEATQAALKAHFGTLFDDHQGIAHLEALEMLSNQSEKKVHSLLNSLAQDDLTTIKPQLMDIKQAFELDDNEDAEGDQDFTSLVSQHLSELQLGTAPDKLNQVHQMVQAWIQDFDSADTSRSQTTKETHEKSIQALAELTAKGVEQFHKAGEKVLIDKDKDKDCIERAHSLARLTGVLCHEIGNLSNKFVACLNKLAEENKSEDVTSMITNIYLEASNSSTYIQDAFQLLLPVLQHAALEQAILARAS